MVESTDHLKKRTTGVVVGTPSVGSHVASRDSSDARTKGSVDSDGKHDTLTPGLTFEPNPIR